MKFADLGLSPELLKAVEKAGYDTPTPIQEQAIPPVLMMKDIIGIAQTGTGKTASFVLPMIDIMASGRRRALMPRSLILEPTRELAAQVAENFEKYGENHDLKMALLIGGVQMGDQIKALNEGVDVLIATPGRLMDLIERGKILLNGCELLVIDEADRMLDMGFIPDIEFICAKLPEPRQTMLFSATMPPPIEKLSKQFMDNPKRIEVSRAATTNADISAFKVMIGARQKRDTLEWFLKNDHVETAIVFSNRKTTVRDLNQYLQRKGFKSGEIHGDIDQATRTKELERFKHGDMNILVASDVAARGLDIKGVSHVFNYDTPWHPDDYVHRIGRTGRAGAKGRAFTFVTPEDAEAIDNVEKLTKNVIPTFGKDDVRIELVDDAASKADSKAPEADAKSESDEKPKRAPRRRKAADEKNDSGERSDRNVNRDRKPRRDAKPREEKPAEEVAREESLREEQPREEKPREEKLREEKPRARRPRRDDGDTGRNAKPPRGRGRSQDDKPVPPGEWNGPQPGFLDVGFD